MYLKALMSNTTVSILTNCPSMPFQPRAYLLLPATSIALTLSLLPACSTRAKPTQYRAYLAEPAHGLTQLRGVNGTVLTCTYRPTDLLVLQDLASASRCTPAIHDSLARAYAGKIYCALTLARDSAEIENQFVNDPAAYQQALAYLNTGLAADTYLSTGTAHDSAGALSSLYVRDFGATGRSTVLFVFDTHQLSIAGGFAVTFHDQRFGLGTQRFAFTARDLAAVPTLLLD